MNKIIKLIFSRRSIVVFLLLIQFWFTSYMIWQTSLNNTVVGATMTAISLVVVIYIINRTDKDGFKIAWIVVILTVPIVGGLLYLMFRIQSSETLTRKKFRYYAEKGKENLLQDICVSEELSRVYPDTVTQHEYLSGTCGYPVYRAEKVEYLSPGEVYYDRMLEELGKAEKYIFIETFIIDEGEMWNRIVDILTEKVKHGVEVRVIYDDMGSLLTLSSKYDRYLEGLGIHCRVFNRFRPFWSTMQNNRDHRKIVVIDGKTAFTGGCNFADEYINKKVRFGHWKDSNIMIGGRAVWTFAVMFLETWNVIKKTDEDFSPFDFRGSETDITSGYVQPYGDSPLDGENISEHVYRKIISDAKKYVYIATPYLILEDSMISALTLAAKSGIDVRILMPGIPDKHLVYATAHAYYEQLLKSGVKIYEYTPGFVHSKVFVSDDSVATVGTANLDFRSIYLHYECGVLIRDNPVIGDIKEDYLRTLQSCARCTVENSKKNFIVRIVRAVMRVFAPLM